MANKDLVKRAFSVTANLPSTRALSTPPASETSASQPVVGPTEPQDDSIAVHPPRVPNAPRTSPGSMLSFMAEQSQVHKEVVQLRERLETFDGAEVARRLDPKSITASKWANRDRTHFLTQAFAKLKAEIESAGGNIQPIKVRQVASAADGASQFEVVYGHRRHQACLELGIPVLALIQPDMKDTQLFVEMDRENRGREDLSPWEQGVMYARALDEGLFSSAKQLAAAIGVDMGTVSKAKALRSLPKEVIDAFASPIELQFRWGKLLTDALQRDPEGVLERARGIIAMENRPNAGEVLKTLIRVSGGGNLQQSGAAEWLDHQGKRVATLRSDRKGKTTLLIETLDESTQRRLVKLLDGFFGLKRE